MKDAGLTIHTDGGARGNPGPAACAFVAELGEKTIGEGALYLGNTTNNFAEYKGVILALEWVIENFDYNLSQDITFYLDSELVVKQLIGIYKVKDAKLQNLFLQVKKLQEKIDLKIFFKNIPREKNKEADRLVNIELDKNPVL